MESFVDDMPVNWSSLTPDLVERVIEQGRVHSGNSSVSLQNGAELAQAITENINAGCFYELSFFAHGEGAEVGFTASVIFVTPTGNVDGATIVVRQQDVPGDKRVFSYYKATTIAAPDNVTGVIISFAATAEELQSLDLDDISFSVR